VSYNSTEYPIVIVDRPECGEKRIYDYDEAVRIYEYYVKVYTQVVKAETKDF